MNAKCKKKRKEKKIVDYVYSNYQKQWKSANTICKYFYKR